MDEKREHFSGWAEATGGGRVPIPSADPEVGAPVAVGTRLRIATRKFGTVEAECTGHDESGVPTFERVSTEPTVEVTPEMMAAAMSARASIGNRQQRRAHAAVARRGR